MKKKYNRLSDDCNKHFSSSLNSAINKHHFDKYLNISQLWSTFTKGTQSTKFIHVMTAL